jgi:hypothetical protein
MKKKLALIALALVGTLGNIASYADAKLCFYRDTIHLDSDTPFDIRLQTLSSNQNLVVEQRDATSFYMRDVQSCPREGGYAYVRYGSDSQHYCDVVIKDGAFEKDPWWVSATCNNMRFGGLTHDGFLSYSYTMHFSKA